MNNDIELQRTLNGWIIRKRIRVPKEPDKFDWYVAMDENTMLEIVRSVAMPKPAQESP